MLQHNAAYHRAQTARRGDIISNHVVTARPAIGILLGVPCTKEVTILASISMVGHANILFKYNARLRAICGCRFANRSEKYPAEEAIHASCCDLL